MKTTARQPPARTPSDGAPIPAHPRPLLRYAIRAARQPPALTVLALLASLAAALPPLALLAAEIAPDEVACAAVAHSYARRALAAEADATEADRSAAAAARAPALAAEARATRYTGLADWQLGPQSLIPAIESRYGAALTVTQPLYTGGRLSGLVQGARLQAAATRRAADQAAQDATLAALNAYWDWSKAWFLAGTLTNAVARVELHARDVANRREAGLATEHDQLATDVLRDRTRLRLESARRAERTARAVLAYLTGAHLAEDATPAHAPVPPVPAPVAPAATEDGEGDQIAAATATRPDRAARHLEALAAATRAKVERSALRPQLAGVLRYEQASPNLLNVPPTDVWQDDAFAGLTATWNLWDWGLTRARARAAAARADAARVRLDQTEQAIALQVREARAALLDAAARAQVAEHAVDSARRGLASARDNWAAGLARPADVLDAHADLTDTLYEVEAARADAARASAALAHALGRGEPASAQGETTDAAP